MSNIINVKEEHNVLSFTGNVLNVVANSTNFYLSFNLDEEWAANAVVTAVFDFDGEQKYVELDENRQCAIPPTSSSKILFCITASPDSSSKLSSTVLSLDVEASGNTNLDDVPIYVNTHTELLGLVQELENGNVNAMHALTATSADSATFATTAGTSQTQVSLTGDEAIGGAKNFTGSILHNNNIVPDVSQMSNPNLVMNGDFRVNTRETINYTRNGTDIFTADRWRLCTNNGKFNVNTKTLTGQDENGPTMLCQWIEEAKIHLGRSVTISAKIDGTRYFATYDIPSPIPSDTTYTVYENETFSFKLFLKKSSKMFCVQFMVVNGSSIVIDEVKLELGTFPTGYFPKPYVEEFLLCQRYYQKVKIFSAGYSTSETNISVWVPLPASFKTARTITITSLPTIIFHDGSTQIASNVTIAQTNDTGLLLNVVATGLTANNFYYLYGGIAKIDGEIY